MIEYHRYILFFFFKQKTAYELRISDWSSDVCSSDLDALCATILERSGMELEAFAIASASRCATSRVSFRTAKSQIIERFERAYITAALGRHSGNIAMAARAAQKHQIGRASCRERGCQYV